TTEDNALGGTAIMKKVVGHMTGRAEGPRMNVTMFLPAKASGPVPVILTITFGGGTGGKFGKILPGKGDPVDEILKRGWAYATIGYGDIQPDSDNKWDQGVIGVTPKPAGQTARAPDEWGTISAWTWG